MFFISAHLQKKNLQIHVLQIRHTFHKRHTLLQTKIRHKVKEIKLLHSLCACEDIISLAFQSQLSEMWEVSHLITYPTQSDLRHIMFCQWNLHFWEACQHVDLENESWSKKKMEHRILNHSALEKNSKLAHLGQRTNKNPTLGHVSFTFYLISRTFRLWARSCGHTRANTALDRQKWQSEERREDWREDGKCCEQSVIWDVENGKEMIARGGEEESRQTNRNPTINSWHTDEAELTSFKKIEEA